MKDGLGLDVTVADSYRTPFKNNKPGIVKIQFTCLGDKIAALRAKRKLTENDQYKRVYIRSSQSHTERLLHLNTQILLKECGAEGRYRLTGSGRLVPKDGNNPNQQNTNR